MKIPAADKANETSGRMIGLSSQGTQCLKPHKLKDKYKNCETRVSLKSMNFLYSSTNTLYVIKYVISTHIKLQK